MDILEVDSTYKEVKGYNYNYFIYIPQEAKECESSSDSIKSVWMPGENYKFEHLCQFFLKSEVTGENIEIPFKITYEDGSEETVTLYVTKE